MIKLKNLFDWHYADRIFRISKEGMWVAAGQGLMIIGSLLVVRVLSELLDAETYGELALGMTLALFVNQVLFGPLSGGVARFYSPATEKKDLAGYLIAVRRLVIKLTFLIFIFMFIVVTGLLLADKGEWIWLALAAQLFALLSGSNIVLNEINTAARQRKTVAFHQGLEASVRVLILVALLLWLGRTSAIAVGGYVLAVLFVLVSQAVFLRRRITQINKEIRGQQESKNWERQIFKFSWPVATWGVFSWAHMASDRWALELFASTEAVGLYTVLFQLGYLPMMALTQAVMQLLAPIFYQKTGAADDSLRNASVSNLNWYLTNISLVLTAVVVLVAYLLHDSIFRVLVASEYASVSYLLPWMLLAGGLFSAGQTLALNLMSQLKTKSMIVVKITTAILGLVFNIAGAYWLGITGIVIANITFSVFYFVWMMLIVIKPKG